MHGDSQAVAAPRVVGWAIRSMTGRRGGGGVVAWWEMSSYAPAAEWIALQDRTLLTESRERVVLGGAVVLRRQRWIAEAASTMPFALGSGSIRASLE